MPSVRILGGRCIVCSEVGKNTTVPKLFSTTPTPHAKGLHSYIVSTSKPQASSSEAERTITACYTTAMTAG